MTPAEARTALGVLPGIERQDRSKGAAADDTFAALAALLLAKAAK